MTGGTPYSDALYFEVTAPVFPSPPHHVGAGAAMPPPGALSAVQPPLTLPRPPSPLHPQGTIDLWGDGWPGSDQYVSFSVPQIPEPVTVSCAALSLPARTAALLPGGGERTIVAQRDVASAHGWGLAGRA